MGALILALLGSHWACVFDPLVLLYRTTATGLLPAFQWAVEESTTPLAQSENPAVKKLSENVTNPAYTFLRDNVWGGTDLEKTCLAGRRSDSGGFSSWCLLNALPAAAGGVVTCAPWVLCWA